MFDEGFDYHAAFSIGQLVGFAQKAEDGQTGDAGLNLKFDQRGNAGEIECAIDAEGRRAVSRALFV